MGWRDKRLAANEMLARRINEMVEQERPRNGGSGEHFVCECDREHCVQVIDISVEEYALVRSDPRRFIVLQGHEDDAIETVVEIHGRYAVVQKRGEAGRLAEADA